MCLRTVILVLLALPGLACRGCDDDEEARCTVADPTSEDDDCDGVDDDCDGATDEAFRATPTTCGRGACQAAGKLVCQAGAPQDTCTPGPPTGEDDDCDGVDDDCDGATDEAFQPSPTTCGRGACQAAGELSCQAGAPQDTCTPGPPTGEDDDCDGVDDDCDGTPDDAYQERVTRCGTGACATTGRSSCTAGEERDTCTPRQPRADDRTCDGLDDDCDGATDEDFPGIRASTSLTAPPEGAFLDTSADVTVEFRHELAAGTPIELRVVADELEVATWQGPAPARGGAQPLRGVDLSYFAQVDRPVTLRSQLRVDGQQVAVSPPVQVHINPSAITLAAIRAAARGEVRLRTNRDLPRVLIADLPLQAADAHSRAMTFLRQFGRLYRLPTPTESFYLIRQVADPDRGEETVILGQRHLAIPVYGSSLRIHLRGDRLSYATSRYLTDLPATLPKLAVSADQAVALALAARSPAGRLLGVPRLVFHDADLLGDALDAPVEPSPTRLAWQLRVRDDAPFPQVWQLFLDAGTGEVLEQLPLTLAEVPDRGASMHVVDEDLHADCISWNFNQYPWCGEIVCDEDRCADDATPEAHTTREHLHFVHSWYDRFLGRDGMDGEGAGVIAVVNVVFDSPNAMWTSILDMLGFSPGYATLGIIGHEYQHGVTYDLHGPGFTNSPGALNESYSDVFGALIAGWSTGTGFECHAGTRDLCQPTSTSDHIDDFQTYDGWDDGGVHANCEIMNHVAALLARGGIHQASRLPVEPIGWERVAHLWYDTLKHDLGRSDGLQDMCEYLGIRSTRYGETGDHGFTPYIACQVENACVGAGMGTYRNDCAVLLTDDVDSDGDGRADLDDNCPLHFQGSFRDSDQDGQGDACDLDLDGDGWLNYQDTCPGVHDPGQDDRDGDRVGDACQDGDRDFHVDAVDNCPDVRNNAQEDQDQDQLGDECDPDQDGDGIDNGRDNCPRVPNPDQRDTDRLSDEADGVGDACDNCIDWHNPDQEDLDHDGEGNGCDPDDDGDRVIDHWDNCPVNYNPEQYDGDDNGVGAECDPGEQRAYFESMGERITRVVDLPALERGLGLPIDVCPDDACPTTFGEDFRFQVTIETDAPLIGAALVDELGDIRDHCYGTQADLGSERAFGCRLTFQPSEALLGLTTREFTAPAYGLRLMAEAGADPVTEIELTVGPVAQRSPR